MHKFRVFPGSPQLLLATPDSLRWQRWLEDSPTNQSRPISTSILEGLRNRKPLCNVVLYVFWYCFTIPNFRWLENPLFLIELIFIATSMGNLLYRSFSSLQCLITEGFLCMRGASSAQHLPTRSSSRECGLAALRESSLGQNTGSTVEPTWCMDESW